MTTILGGFVLVLGLLGPMGGDGSPDPTTMPSVHWLGADGEALPFATDEEVLEFLRTAEIVSSKPLSRGINRPLKLLLVKDGVRAHAVFRSVHTRVKDDSRRYGKVSPPRFRDNFVFECAAFELGRLLGYDRIPPVVERRYRGTSGSIQLWVENAMDLTTLYEKGLETPDRDRWARQMQSRRVFDALIGNYDRNSGNLLLDEDWNLWLIDHTRTFPADTHLGDLDGFEYVSGSLWEGLCKLDRGTVAEALSPYLGRRELAALFTRWDGLVTLLPERSADLGQLSCGAPGTLARAAGGGTPTP